MSGSPAKAHDGQPRPYGVVAFDAGSLAGGGAERSMLLVAAHWPDGPLRARLMLGVHSGPYVTDIPLDLGVDEVGSTRYLALPMFFLRVRRAIRRHRIVAIAAFDRRARVLIAARCVGLVPRRAIVVVEQNTLSSVLKDRYSSSIARRCQVLIRRWLYRRADAIVGVSDGVSRDLEATLSLPSGSVITIYNPVDTERITAAMTEPVPEALSHAFEMLRRPIVITTGRLVTQKAHRDLLAAFALLPEPTRGSLVILGEGPLRGDLEQQARQLGIAKDVWMPGFVENPWWFMARSDIFALSSHCEGFGRVLVEALACNVPVVSTDCPHGPREILEGVANTRLVPVGNSKALAVALGEVLTSTEPKVAPNLSRYEPRSVASQYAEVVSRASRV